ncbi:MAG: hypothetical protein VCD50_13330 [Alphaproteobacteria bacterium]
MRALTFFLSLFTFVMLSIPSSSESTAGVEKLTPNAEIQLTQTDLTVLRLASDFSVNQSKISDLIVNGHLSDRSKECFIVVEKTLRHEVIRVVSAARIRDHDTVRALLPALAGQVRQQILILLEADSVARQWASARSKSREMAERSMLPGSELLLSALAEIDIGV